MRSSDDLRLDGFARRYTGDVIFHLVYNLE